ncbi:hypothetical protein PoB_004551200 [Plakobranchus ocellatus]|uniref:Uncharacterized protein n=1 Tax=Plakobranchus ocellatus TaxID=259542 RepID=A0AAV4BJA6_9GAST|nr:hypothetical protein PoB_004551200 [Plakobranchus ocellatus]
MTTLFAPIAQLDPVTSRAGDGSSWRFPREYVKRTGTTVMQGNIRQSRSYQDGWPCVRQMAIGLSISRKILFQCEMKDTKVSAVTDVPEVIETRIKFSLFDYSHLNDINMSDLPKRITALHFDGLFASDFGKVLLNAKQVIENLKFLSRQNPKETKHENEE